MVRGSEEALKAFAARRKEWSLAELKQATVGCHSSAWRVENGHDVPETILRAKNVQGYIVAAEQARVPKSAPEDQRRQARLDRLAEMQKAAMENQR